MMTENAGRKEEKLNWKCFRKREGEAIYSYLLENDFYRIAGDGKLDWLKKSDVSVLFDTREVAEDACFKAVNGADSGYVVLCFDDDTGDLTEAAINFDNCSFWFWKVRYDELFGEALEKHDWDAQDRIKEITGLEPYYSVPDTEKDWGMLESEDLEFEGLFRSPEDAIDYLGEEYIEEHGLFSDDEEIIV